MQKNNITHMEPSKLLAAITFVCIALGAILFQLDILNVLPLFISIIIMFLQTRVNRYAFLLGAINAIFYSIAYFYMTLYSTAAYALLISFPLQVITFINWQKNTSQGVTGTRRFSAKGRILLFLGMALSWVVLYIIFSLFQSEYLLFDNTVAVIGIVATLLCAMRYAEYAALQIISNAISILLYSYMTFQDRGKVVWLIFSVYSVICSAVAFAKMNKGVKK